MVTKIPSIQGSNVVTNTRFLAHYGFVLKVAGWKFIKTHEKGTFATSAVPDQSRCTDVHAQFEIAFCFETWHNLSKTPTPTTMLSPQCKKDPHHTKHCIWRNQVENRLELSEKYCASKMVCTKSSSDRNKPHEMSPHFLRWKEHQYHRPSTEIYDSYLWRYKTQRTRVNFQAKHVWGPDWSGVHNPEQTPNPFAPIHFARSKSK